MSDDLKDIAADTEWTVSVRLVSRNEDMPLMPADKVTLSLSKGWADGMLHPWELLARDMATLINQLIQADVASYGGREIDWSDIAQAFENALDHRFVQGGETE